jgi:7-keto-8-aminopelargonate synthetase-like enzyme
MVDEAHSLGVLGKTGRGVGEHFSVHRREVDIWMGTLSKSLASCGGYIAGSKELVELLKYSAPGFVYSVGLSPPNAAAALACLDIIEREPERVTTLHERAASFLAACQRHGLNTGFSHGSAVVPVIVGHSLRCIQLAAALFERQINVQPIVYPAVEDNAARLRFFISALHSQAGLEETAKVIAQCLKDVSGGAVSPGLSERGANA